MSWAIGVRTCCARTISAHATGTEAPPQTTLFAIADSLRALAPPQLRFYLSEPAKAVTIEIVDDNGALVRELTVDGGLEAGVHSLVWDQRYAGAAVFPGMILEARSPRIGPLVLPGNYQARNESPKDKIAYPIQLNDRLAMLYQFLVFGDGRPTQPQYAVYEELSSELDAVLTRYRRLVDALSPALSAAHP
ncbi:MAG: FlgD immunoglobulin-like domain containing protein [Halieaceae bacterium]|jgi:hypothetical protein|nr:FlgD immunoglobulin-like domain containing protein [Halieaceae bacterium]